MPTTRLPSSHSSRTSASLSIRYESAPWSRATSTSRFEFDELRDPITSTRSHSHSHLADGRLAVRGGVTDVVGARPDDVREALAQPADDRVGLVHGQRGLGDVGDAVRVVDLEGVDVGLGLDQHDAVGRLAHRALDLLVARVADEHDRVALRGELLGLHVHLGDERAGGVDRAQRAALGVRCTDGATPWAENTTVSPSGTSVSWSTNTAPRSRSCSTTCLLWTISLRT